MKKIILFFIAFAINSNAFAINKCVDKSGKVTFSDIPCSSDTTNARKNDSSNPPQKKNTPVSDPLTIKTLEENCMRSVKNRTVFKDPESVRIEGAPSCSEVEYYVNGKKNIKYITYVMINAKNSYGAYAGSKPYKCTHSGEFRVTEVQ